MERRKSVRDESETSLKRLTSLGGVDGDSISAAVVLPSLNPCSRIDRPAHAMIKAIFVYLHHHFFVSLFQFPQTPVLHAFYHSLNPLCSSPGTPKPTRSSHTLLQILHLHNLRRVYPLQHQLRNPVSLLNLEIHLAMVKQQNLHLTPIIRVNHAGARVDEVLGRKARPRRHTTVSPLRRCDREIRRHECLAPRGDCAGL